MGKTNLTRITAYVTDEVATQLEEIRRQRGAKSISGVAGELLSLGGQERDRPPLFRLRREAWEIVKREAASSGRDYLDIINDILTGRLVVSRRVEIVVEQVGGPETGEASERRPSGGPAEGPTAEVPVAPVSP